MRFKIRDHHLLGIVILVGFIVRYYFAQHIWILPDEGNWLYDAFLFTKGYFPSIDYASRSLVYIFSLAPFIKLFGNTLMAGRLLSVIAEVISVYFIFKIGKELYNEKIGLIASLFYAISPVLIFWGSILQTEPLQRMFIIIAMFFLVHAIKTEKTRYFFLNGVFICLAAFVRLSALVFILFEALFLLYLYTNNIKILIKKALYIPQWFFDKDIKNVIKKVSFICLPCLFLLLLFFSKYFCFPTKALLGSRSLEYFIINRLGMSYALIKEAVYLIIPTALFFIYLIKKRKFIPPLIYLFLSAYIIGEIANYLIMGNPFNIPILFSSIFILLLLPLSLTLLPLIKLNINFTKFQKHKFSNKFLVFWFLAPFLFYLFYWTWHIAYFTEMAGVVCLMAGVVIYSLFKSKKSKFVFNIFITLLFFTMIFSQSLHFYQPYFTSRGIDRVVAPSIVEEVSDYIETHTIKDEEIFSNTIFAFSAERRIIFDISHAMGYHYETEGIEAELGYPTINEIIRYLDDTKLNYIIIDPSFKEAYLSLHPDLENYIYTQYSLEKQIDNVGIYKRNI